jgi:hypothetical protein
LYDPAVANEVAVDGVEGGVLDFEQEAGFDGWVEYEPQPPLPVRGAQVRDVGV